MVVSTTTPTGSTLITGGYRAASGSKPTSPFAAANSEAGSALAASLMTSCHAVVAGQAAPDMAPAPSSNFAP